MKNKFLVSQIYIVFSINKTTLYYKVKVFKKKRLYKKKREKILNKKKESIFIKQIDNESTKNKSVNYYNLKIKYKNLQSYFSCFFI